MLNKRIFDSILSTLSKPTGLRELDEGEVVSFLETQSEVIIDEPKRIGKMLFKQFGTSEVRLPEKKIKVCSNTQEGCLCDDCKEMRIYNQALTDVAELKKGLKK